VQFMHRAAEVELYRLLRALGIHRPLLVGHSDGASISLLYTALKVPPRPCGLALIAPHVFVEQRTLTGARAAVTAYSGGDLRQRLARHHADPDSAFQGWSQVWLRPEFRHWNIEAAVSSLRVPLTLIQGRDDEYGTLAQLHAIEARYGGRASVRVLDRCGHDPPRQRPEATAAAIAAIVPMTNL